MSTRYLHVYLAPSRQWSGKVLEEVAGIAGCSSSFAVEDEAYERFPDIEHLPIDAPPPGGRVETAEVNADALAELIEAAEQMLAVRFHAERVAAKSRLRAAVAQVKGGLT